MYNNFQFLNSYLFKFLYICIHLIKCKPLFVPVLPFPKSSRVRPNQPISTFASLPIRNNPFAKDEKCCERREFAAKDEICCERCERRYMLRTLRKTRMSAKLHMCCETGLHFICSCRGKPLRSILQGPCLPRADTVLRKELRIIRVCPYLKFISHFLCFIASLREIPPFNHYFVIITSKTKRLLRSALPEVLP